MDTHEAPLINSFRRHPMDAAEIEARSLAIIDEEAPPHHFTAEEWIIVRRMIHATADFTLKQK